MDDIPERYVPEGLSKKDKKKQIKSIKEGKDRPKVDFKTKKSTWTEKAHKYFGEAPSLDEIVEETGVKKKALEEIIDRGEAAYYSSGSRPNVSAKQWGLARMYAVLFGSKGARKADNDIIEEYDIPNLGSKKGGSKSADILRKKSPKNITEEADKIIDTISFEEGKNASVLGSMAFRSRQYAHDFDLVQRSSFTSFRSIRTNFQTIIRNVINKRKLFIGDIKCGEVEDWIVIPELLEPQQFIRSRAVNKLERLIENGIVSRSEVPDIEIPENPTIGQLAKLKKELRFNILRWTPKEILNNKKTFRGRTFTLEEALQTRGLFKADFVAIMSDNLLQEFNIVYDYRVEGFKLALSRPFDPVRALRDEIDAARENKQFFKMVKRQFSLASLLFDNPKKRNEAISLLKKSFNILNSDLGLLAQVVQDIETIQSLPEQDIPKSTIKAEIANMINRLSNVYTSTPYLQNEDKILTRIRNIDELSQSTLDNLQEYLTKILNKSTRDKIIELRRLDYQL